MCVSFPCFFRVSERGKARGEKGRRRVCARAFVHACTCSFRHIDKHDFTSTIIVRRKRSRNALTPKRRSSTACSHKPSRNTGSNFPKSSVGSCSLQFALIDASDER